MNLNYITLIRPKQWVKNVFVLAPLLFANQFLSLLAWKQALLATFVFCIAASTIYILNDLHDRAEDQHHPEKCKRPLAAGLIHPFYAILWLFCLAVVSLSLTLIFLPIPCLLVLIFYWFVNIIYTYFLKHFPLLDVMGIAVSFALRVLMGAYAIPVPASLWIMLCTFVLALFLSLGKRRQDMEIEIYRYHRKSLRGYSVQLLDALLIITATSSLVFYALYTVETAERSQNSLFIYTTLFVIFGIFRYLWGLYQKTPQLSPEDFFFKDKPFLVNFMLWVLAIILIFMYG